MPGWLNLNSYHSDLKLDWLQKVLFVNKTQNRTLASLNDIKMWAKAKDLKATAAYSNVAWQEVIQPGDIYTEVNKTAPTAEGTLWSHSTTLPPFMSSPESDAQSVCLAGANCCGDSSLWREANWKTNL